MSTTVEIFKDDAGEWRYRIKGGNSEIMVTSEGYSRQSDAVRGFRDLQQNIINNPLVKFEMEG